MFRAYPKDGGEQEEAIAQEHRDEGSEAPAGHLVVCLLLSCARVSLATELSNRDPRYGGAFQFKRFIVCFHFELHDSDPYFKEITGYSLQMSKEQTAFLFGSL